MATSRNRDYSAPLNNHNISNLYAWNENAIITGAQNPQTGAWQSANLDSQGNLKVAIDGNINITGVTVNQSILEGYAETGNMLSVSGNAYLASISGDIRFLRTGNAAIAITGTKVDLASGWSGFSHLSVGGRVVSISAGFSPNYSTGTPASINIDSNVGGILTIPTDLDYNYDSVTSYPPQTALVSNSNPSGSHPTGLSIITGMILNLNTGRKGWSVTNMSTTSPLYIRLSNSAASSNAFNFVLNPATTNSHAGGSFNDIPASYLGPVTISGAGQFISFEF